MDIREARSSDSIEITKMYRELYQEEFSEEKLIPIEHSKIISKIFLVQADEIITGFIWITIVEYGESRYGYIEELFVKPPYRNMDYGSTLVEKAKEFFTENAVKAVFVSVERHDKELGNFYNKQNFHECEGLWYYYTRNN